MHGFNREYQHQVLLHRKQVLFDSYQEKIIHIDGMIQAIEQNNYIKMTQKLENILELVTISKTPIIAAIGISFLSSIKSPSLI